MHRSLPLVLLLTIGCGSDDDAPAETTSTPTTDTDTGTPDTVSITDTSSLPTDSVATADTGSLVTTDADPDVDTYVPPGWPPLDPARVIFLGDSITDGVGVANQDLAYPSLLVSNDDATWPDHLDGDLSSRWPGIEVIDVARSGATTETVLAGQLPAIEAALGGPPVGPTLVVGTVGGNDVSGTIFGFGNLEEEAPKIVDRVDDIAAWFADPARFPDGAYVYLTNVYEPTDAEGQADECFFGLNLSNIQPTFEAINADMRVRAEQNSWAMVDLRGHFKGHGFNHDDPKIAAYHADDPTLWLSRDCIHPNQRGHHEVRRLFLAAIDALPLRSTP